MGPQLTRVLLTLMPELGRVSRERIAALVGVAPYDNDSGSSTGRRSCRGGRPQVRTVLHMAAVSASVHNPKSREIYLRMLGNGACKMQALTAVSRKLLIKLNSIAREIDQQMGVTKGAVIS